MHYHSYYKEFNETEFAADEYFQQWILSNDDSINEFWQSFLNLYPAKIFTVKKAKQLVYELVSGNHHYPLTANEKAALKKTIFQRLNIEQADHSILYSSNKAKLYAWLAAASIIIIAISAGFIFFNKPVKEKSMPAIAQIISSTETKEILLPDSSLVVLNAGSSVSYKNDFLQNREIHLSGNAFFKVKKQIDHRPFIVHTQSLDITVLGTQFNVDARTAATEISLTSGKVKISEAGNADAAFMLPGEKIKLDTADHVLIKSKFDTTLYSAWMDNKWNFRKTTLEEIAGLIYKYYGVVTEFKEEKYKKIRVTSIMPVNSVDILANILSKTLQASHIQVQKINDRLIIQ